MSQSRFNGHRARDQPDPQFPAIHTHIRVMSLNVSGGFFAKHQAVLHQAEKEHCDVIAVQEIWDCSLLNGQKHGRYTWFTQPSSQRNTGGTALAVIDWLMPSLIRTQGHKDGHWTACVFHDLVKEGARNTTVVCSAYMPTNLDMLSDTTDSFKLAAQLHEDIRDLCGSHAAAILMGDFNETADPAMDRDSHNAAREGQPVGRLINDLPLQDCFRTVHPQVRGHTQHQFKKQSAEIRSSARLDYCFASANLTATEARVIPTEIISTHSALVTHLTNVHSDEFECFSRPVPNTSAVAANEELRTNLYEQLVQNFADKNAEGKGGPELWEDLNSNMPKQHVTDCFRHITRAFVKACTTTVGVRNANDKSKKQRASPISIEKAQTLKNAYRHALVLTREVRKYKLNTNAQEWQDAVTRLPPVMQTRSLWNSLRTNSLQYLNWRNTLQRRAVLLDRKIKRMRWAQAEKQRTDEFVTNPEAEH